MRGKILPLFNIFCNAVFDRNFYYLLRLQLLPLRLSLQPPQLQVGSLFNSSSSWKSTGSDWFYHSCKLFWHSFFGCGFVIGYCREQLDGTQDLEKKRVTQPVIASDQSTSVNAKKPWTFSLDYKPSLEDRGVGKNPNVTIEFKTAVTVTGVKLQGSKNDDDKIGIILLAKYRLDETFVVVQTTSGEALVSEAFLNRNPPLKPD